MSKKKLYSAAEITHTLTFVAESQEQAEQLRNAWYADEPCPIHGDEYWECGCYLGDDEELDVVWESADCLHEGDIIKTNFEDGHIIETCKRCEGMVRG